MRITIIALEILLIVPFVEPAIGQDPVISQVFSNLLFLNPAYAGSGDFPRIGAGYRNQWPDLNNAYVTYYASYDQPIPALHGGLGLNLMNDRMGAGVFNRFQSDLSYAYEIRISSDISVNAGLQASYIYRNISPGSLVFPDMLETGSSQEILSSSRNGLLDFATGFAGSWHTIYLGGSMHHLFQPLESVNTTNPARLNREYTLYAGTNIEMNRSTISKGSILVSPAAVWQYQRGYHRVDLGSYIKMQSLFIGFWVRQYFPGNGNLLASAHAGFSWSSFRITYSYDFFLHSNAGLPHSGAHEISLLSDITYKSTRKKMKAIKCPKI